MQHAFCLLSLQRHMKNVHTFTQQQIKFRKPYEQRNYYQARGKDAKVLSDYPNIVVIIAAVHPSP